jgi:hypothetical protein
VPTVPNTSFMQDAGYGLRRIHLLGTRVNRARKRAEAS